MRIDGKQSKTVRRGSPLFLITLLFGIGILIAQVIFATTVSYVWRGQGESVAVNLEDQRVPDVLDSMPEAIAKGPGGSSTETLPPMPSDLPPMPSDLPPMPSDLPPMPSDLPPMSSDLPPGSPPSSEASPSSPNSNPAIANLPDGTPVISATPPTALTGPGQRFNDTKAKAAETLNLVRKIDSLPLHEKPVLSQDTQDRIELASLIKKDVPSRTIAQMSKVAGSTMKFGDSLPKKLNPKFRDLPPIDLKVDTEVKGIDVVDINADRGTSSRVIPSGKPSSTTQVSSSKPAKPAASKKPPQVAKVRSSVVKPAAVATAKPPPAKLAVVKEPAKVTKPIEIVESEPIPNTRPAPIATATRQAPAPNPDVVSVAPPRPPTEYEKMQNAEDRLKLAKDYIRLGKYAEAEQQLEQITRLTPHYSKAYKERANLYESQKEFDAAIAQWQIMSSRTRLSTDRALAKQEMERITRVKEREQSAVIAAARATAPSSITTSPSSKTSSVIASSKANPNDSVSHNRPSSVSASTAPGSRRLRIVSEPEVERFGKTARFDDYRLLHIHLKTNDGFGPFDPKKLEVRHAFFDRDRRTGRIYRARNLLPTLNVDARRVGLSHEIALQLNYTVPFSQRMRDSSQGFDLLFRGFYTQIFYDGVLKTHVGRPADLLDHKNDLQTIYPKLN